MVIGKLQPLEFTDCLLDSPEFRENLNQHEKELEKTSQQIKRIIKEVKDLLAAAKSKLFSELSALWLPLVYHETVGVFDFCYYIVDKIASWLAMQLHTWHISKGSIS